MLSLYTNRYFLIEEISCFTLSLSLSFLLLSFLKQKMKVTSAFPHLQNCDWSRGYILLPAHPSVQVKSWFSINVYSIKGLFHCLSLHVSEKHILILLLSETLLFLTGGFLPCLRLSDSDSTDNQHRQHSVKLGWILCSSQHLIGSQKQSFQRD